jgi:hypothetical protein
MRRQISAGWPLVRPALHELARLADAALPAFVRESAAALKYLRLLGELDWAHFPELPHRMGPCPAPQAPFVAAYLIKLDKGLPSMPKLQEYLCEQPALVWVLGFQLVASPHYSWGFDVAASLPTHRHWSRLLRTLPAAQTQFLLASTVQLLQRELPPDLLDGAVFGEEISLDTKHIVAWVKENNPKAYVKERYNKHCQPKGDPECKLGCKQKNKQPASEEVEPAPATPTSAGLPASGPLPALEKGEYYWGYASGVVATKVEDWGEFVLADFTQTFDKGDATYFFPLMSQSEANLGRKPKSGALDKAYDAFYVYEYFHQAGGFAAVPWSDRQDHHKTFSAEGLPLCAAGLPMPLRSKVNKQSHCLVPHEVGRFACPLLFPEKTGAVCPIDHKNWQRSGKDQGCLTTLPTSIGNRIRHQLDRTSAEYKRLFTQRTATERINSQAKELGIERPKLRNYRSIAHQNTLIYVLINLRARQRIRQRKATALPLPG